MKPMKLTDVGTAPEVVDQYVHNSKYVMQQKFDGARMLVVYENGEFLFTNDGVKPIAFSAAKLKLPALEEDLSFLIGGRHRVVFDGELIIDSGIYYIFDLLALEFEDAPGADVIREGTRLQSRLDLLAGMAETSLVKLTPTAYSAQAKIELYQRAFDMGVEGVVSKHLDSLYVPGTRSKDWVKHKFVKSADVVVTSVTREFKANGVVEKGSAELAVPISYDQDPAPWEHEVTGKRINLEALRLLSSARQKPFHLKPRSVLPIGSASLIGKDLTIKEGSVVEIEYLYWTGSAPIQPRITRQRWDKLPEECDLDQFPAYTRDVAWTDAQ